MTLYHSPTVAACMRYYNLDRLHSTPQNYVFYIYVIYHQSIKKPWVKQARKEDMKLTDWVIKSLNEASSDKMTLKNISS